MHDALRRDFAVNGVINMTDDWDWIPYAAAAVTAIVVAVGLRCSVCGLVDERGASGQHVRKANGDV